MTEIERQESRIAAIGAQLEKIDAERRQLGADFETAETTLAQARNNLAGLQSRIAAGLPVEAQDLLTDTQAVNAAETGLTQLEQKSGHRLAKLTEEAEKLQREKSEAQRALQKAKLSDAVIRYQEALQHHCVPITAEIRSLAAICGVTLPPWGRPSLLADVGLHTIGGIVIELKRPRAA